MKKWCKHIHEVEFPPESYLRGKHWIFHGVAHPALPQLFHQLPVPKNWTLCPICGTKRPPTTPKRKGKG